MSLKDHLTSQLAVKLYIIFSTLFIVVFVLDAWVMPAVVHSRSEIAIPDVESKSVGEATTLLVNAGLSVVIHDTISHQTIDMGNVVYQNPLARSVVRKGRNVYLTVSGGEEYILMPNLRGRSLRDARIELDRLNLAVGKVSYEVSDLPPETVAGQNVPAGKEIRKNTPIEITVSGGASLEVEVPYVIGLPLDDAQRKLVERGLRPGTIEFKESPAWVPNTVLGQHPTAGDIVFPNTLVNLTVAH